MKHWLYRLQKSNISVTKVTSSQLDHLQYVGV